MIDFHQFDCTDHTTALRYIETSNGSRQYRYQCVKCGSQVGSTAIKYSSLAEHDKANASPFDYDLQKAQYEERLRAYRAAQEAERTAESIAWFSEHNEYLRSKEWKEKKLLVIQRDHNTCTARLQGCTHTAEEVHHLSYEHWKNEPLFELASICRHCHSVITTMDRERRSR